MKALAAYGHYLKLQLFPFQLFPEYPINRDWGLVLLGALGLIPIALLTKRIVGSKQLPHSFILFASFFILLIPTLGFITSPLEFAADRLSYLPSLFFWAAVAFLLSELKLPRQLHSTRLVIPLSLIHI